MVYYMGVATLGVVAFLRGRKKVQRSPAGKCRKQCVGVEVAVTIDGWTRFESG